MKTELTLTQLAAIGAGAAQFAEGKPLIGNLTVHPTRSGYAGDQPFREAFARAVRDAVLRNQTITTDPYAELKKAHAEGKVIEHRNMGDTWTTCALPSWMFPPDFYRIKPKPETFEAHGKTWTRHKAGDPMPCDGKAQVEVIYGADNRWLSKQRAQWWNWISGTITGWCHADEQPTLETPAWTPAVGDVVQLKSGGPKMTILSQSLNDDDDESLPDTWFCGWIDSMGSTQTWRKINSACLTLVTE